MTSSNEWRYGCPKGHVSIRNHARNKGIFCIVCKRSYTHRVDRRVK